MTIKQMHKAIKKMLPEGVFIVVEHSYRNYSDTPEYNEMWTAHAYGAESGKPGDNQLFCLSSHESPENLIAIVKEAIK